MQLNSIVNFAAVELAASSPSSSSVVPGTAANEGAVTQVDLTMSNESVDDSYGGSGGHSPPLLHSSDISSVSLDAASSTARKLPVDFVDMIESSKNNLPIRNSRVNRTTNITRDLSSSSSSSSSFSSDRPHYSHVIMPYSTSFSIPCNQLSEAPQMSSKQPFIHRSVSPCYLSSNSLSSSLSAISSSSVSSSSSSSDNDSLDELEHLASKFTHNIASIWSHSHQVEASYLHPSMACDSDNTTRQQSAYESRWMSQRQHNLLPHSQPAAGDNSLNANLFQMKPATLGNNLPANDMFPPTFTTKSYDAASSAAAAKTASGAGNFKLSENNATAQMSPTGKNCQSIWSYDSPGHHCSNEGDSKKSHLKTAHSQPKKGEPKSKSGKSKRDACSMTRTSQVNLSGGNGIETIDLTEDDEAAACQVTLIDNLDQQAARDANGSIIWLEDHLRLASLNDTGDRKLNLIVNRGTGKQESSPGTSVDHATRSKSNDTVTDLNDDCKTPIGNNDHCFTSSSSSSSSSLAHSPKSLLFNSSHETGVKSSKSQGTHYKLDASSNIDRTYAFEEHVSLANHTASSLFKPGSNRKLIEIDRESAGNFVNKSAHLQDKQVTSLSQAEIPPWYLHYLANVISNESSRGLDSISLDMTYEKVNQLKRLYETYFETHEDLYTSPKTHFQPIRQDYYERPCNIVTDASIVGIIPCSRNCPNHAARGAAAARRKKEQQAEESDGGGKKKAVQQTCNDSTVPPTTSPLTVTVIEQNPALTVASNSAAKARPMSESREELASFIGPFSPVESRSMSDCEEYPAENINLSRGPVAAASDSINTSSETNCSSHTSRSCGGDPCLNVTLSNQGKIVSQRELTTSPLFTARAHASMIEGNGVIEVPSKCSSNIDAKTEGECNIRQVSSDGESGTNSRNNHSLGDTAEGVDCNRYRNVNDMIIDAHTCNSHTTDINSISSKNRCQLNSKYLQPQIMSQSTSKVIIEEVESDEVTSTGNEIMFNATPSKSTNTRSTVTIEDAPLNENSDSPVDDYDAIFSIVNDVLKSNQIVIEEGEYEDELKLLPSELKQDQRFVHSNLFSSSLKSPPSVSPSNFIPSNNANGLDWSIDSPHNWSMFSSSRLSSDTSPPSANRPSPPRTSNAVSSTTCNNSGLQDSCFSMDTHEFSPHGDKFSNRLRDQAEVAIFVDASSNSSSSSSGYFTYNSKQNRNHFENQHSHVSSTVSLNESAVSSSNHEASSGNSVEMTCSPRSGYTGPYFKRERPYAFENRDDLYDQYPHDNTLPISFNHHGSSNSHPCNRNPHVSTSSTSSNSDSSSASCFNNSRLPGKSDVSTLRKKGESQVLANPLREKSSSPTVYQIEPRLEKVTAFSSKPCTFFLEGNCRKSDCKYSHDLSTITCKFWKEGFCFKGDMCPFAHDDLGSGSLQCESSPSSLDAHLEEEKHVFTIDSEADFPSLADEKRPKLASNRNISSDATLNAINLQVNCHKRNNSNKNHPPSKGFTAVASVLNSTNNNSPFLSSSLTHSTSNVLFIDKSQSNGKGKKKKRTALKAI